MGKHTFWLKLQKFSHSLQSFIVYILLFILTMGTSPISIADASSDEEMVPQQKILYLLLVAEMAAQRHLQNLALDNYLKAAHMTTDPSVAEQATLFAISTEAPHEAILSAELWADKAPHDLQAQLIAMTLLISQSIEKTIPYLKRAIDLAPQEVDQYILEIQTRLSKESAYNLKKALNQIAIDRPSDPYAHLIAAQSAAQEKDVKNAKRWVEAALKQKPDLTRAIVLKSRLIRYEKNSEKEALQFLAKALQRFPKNAELRFFYANALLDNKNYKAVKRELTKLTQDAIFGGPSLLLLGEIYIKENQWKAATDNLKKALNTPHAKSGAQFLLGEIEERRGHPEAAIEWYSTIEPGSYHIPAILRASALLKEKQSYREAITLLHNSTPSTAQEQKDLLLAEIDLLNANKAFEDAMQLANEILPKIPDDTEVLYLRAITATKLKQWHIAENDLKKILEQDPNHANALNALGYILALNSERLPEAIRYFTEALNLAPDNPHFMDNIGWAYYRLGNIEQALAYLKKANDLSQDSNIAAHFGEVLWMNNQKDKAILIWKKALKNGSEQEELIETLKRFKVEVAPTVVPTSTLPHETRDKT